jgi:hypothetical protein
MLKTHRWSVGLSLLLAIALALISASALWAETYGSFTLSCNGNTPDNFGLVVPNGCCNQSYCASQYGTDTYECNWDYTGSGSSCCVSAAISIAASDGLTCTCTGSGCND